jgi:hypothetical protein
MRHSLTNRLVIALITLLVLTSCQNSDKTQQKQSCRFRVINQTKKKTPPLINVVHVNKQKPCDVLFEIVQGGKKIKPKRNVFYLKKLPFAMLFKMINVDGIYISASYIKTYYEMPDSIGIEGLGTKVLPEYGGNQEKSIYIDSIGLHYWCSCPVELVPYFTNKFDHVKIKGDTIIGERTVENYDDEKSHKIGDIDSDIYLIILLMRHVDGKPERELKRLRFMIKWNLG